MKEKYKITVNGKKHPVEAEPDTPLLYVLRNQLGLHGPKYGCGLGQCGACMVLIDNQPGMSCLLPIGTIKGKEVHTLAGIAEKDAALHPVQQAFLEEQAAQCGYCTNGMIMAAIALLMRNPEPTTQEIRQALQINLCRCGSQSRVIRAVQRAIQMI